VKIEESKVSSQQSTLSHQYSARSHRIDIVESVKMATTTLVANKLRSSLTMLGIIIGNASVIAMVGIGQERRSWHLSNFSPWVLMFYCSSWLSKNSEHYVEVPKTLVLEDAKAIATQVLLSKKSLPN
jgi:putative ABC transport system permease protein